MALFENAGGLLSAALSGGAAVEAVRLAIDFVKGRRARSKSDEERAQERAAADRELLHKSEIEFRRDILQRLQGLEAENDRLRGRVRQLEDENDRLRASIRQMEGSHAAD